MSSVFDDLIVDVTPAPSRVTGRDLPITDSAQEEIDAWSGLKEYDSEAYPRLEAYWDHLGTSGWTPTGTAWSGAFISWLLRDYGFVGNGYHSLYTRSVIEGESPGWQAFSTDSDVEINVGDVFVRRRSGGFLSGPGDVVYKIDRPAGLAYLVGGNLSDTVGISSIPLEGSNNYEIVLKRNAGQKKNQWLLMAAAAGAVWILTKS